MSINNFSLSKNGRNEIEKHEGKVNTIYKDIAGFSTIGIGHLIQEGERIKTTLSDKEVYDLFAKDISRFETGINSAVKVKLNQNQFDALVSFSFNIGMGAFIDSTLLRLLNQGDYTGAAEQFLRWDKAGGKTVVGLSFRRKAERKLFLKPYRNQEGNDYNNHWGKSSIEWALDNGLINGYADGSIKPDSTLTRAEMLTILKNYHDNLDK